MTSGQTAYARYQNQRIFGSLDGLRCICILLVIWHHSPLRASEELWPTLLTRGFSGVDFFFVLSGYLITTLLLREETRNGRFSIRGFYWRRILRIIPVYFLVVTLVALWWIGVRGQDQYLDLLPYYYLFLANFLNGDIPLLTPMWSLSVEEQYYLIWPALLLLLPARIAVRAGILVGLIVLSVLVGAGALPAIEVAPATSEATFILPMQSYAAILIGSLAALTLHAQRGFQVLWGIFGHRWSAPLFSAVLVLIWAIMPLDLTGIPFLVMHLTMAAIIIALVMREDNGLAPILTIKPVARIGAISYGLYLWHLIGRHIGVEVGAVAGDSMLIANVIYVVASIAIAEVSFRFFESYFLQLKDRRRAET